MANWWPEWQPLFGQPIVYGAASGPFYVGGNPDSNVELYRGGPPASEQIYLFHSCDEQGYQFVQRIDATPEVLAQPINKSNGLKKKVSGLSLPELMVSIAVVSMVGAGMYVGFQQIDSARQVAEQTLSNENQQGLLLDLIESETNLAGQGVSDGKSVPDRPSGSGFASDCSGDAINPVGQSHGVAVCRQIVEDYQTTLFYASGPGTALGNNRTDDLRCGTATDQFYQSYSKVFTGASCTCKRCYRPTG